MIENITFTISQDMAIGVINAVIYMKLHELKAEDLELYKMIIHINQSKKDICKIVAAVVFFDIQKMDKKELAKLNENDFINMAQKIFNKYFILKNID